MTASLREDGELVLRSGATGDRFRCRGAGAAMWLALRQHDGHCDAAADMLARIWEADPADVRAELRSWAAELWDAGLVRPAA
ncbi:PqqD family peptide modification chaperone [Micromonospora sp. CPCC 205711]|uniref:PqqD family peptide modification chaperone n=1 Tax=Micromonospora sp. CPCC 205547 TaxID=3122400 RepID=UPI002FEEC5A8